MLLEEFRARKHRYIPCKSPLSGGVMHESNYLSFYLWKIVEVGNLIFLSHTLAGSS